MYGHLKVDTATVVNEALDPIRKKTQELLNDRGELERILKKKVLSTPGSVMRSP